jgi:hypothetical protein
MRFPLLAITAIAAAFTTSNANATEATVFCHFPGHNFRMESKEAGGDGSSGEFDMYRDGSYLGPWRYRGDAANRLMATFAPDNSVTIGFALPARRSLTSDQLAKSIPMAKSLFIVMSTKQEIPGDCTMYPKG